MCRPLIATTRIRQHHTTILHHCSQKKPSGVENNKICNTKHEENIFSITTRSEKKSAERSHKERHKIHFEKPHANIVQANTSLCTRRTNPSKRDRSLAKATPRHNGTRTPHTMAHQTSHTSQNLRNNAATELNTSSRAHAAERAWTPAHFDSHHVLATRDKHQGARTLHDI